MNSSVLEVSEINQKGVWLCWNTKKHFLSYETFPWFREAKVSEILNVQHESSGHLHWPDLDVDLSLANVTEPEKYLLVAS